MTRVKRAAVDVSLLNFHAKAVFVLAGGVVATPGAASPRVLVKETTDGRVTLPSGPGLGVDVDEAWVRAHALPLPAD